MSVVYLARDRQLLAKRSCRVLLEETSVDPWIRQKFQQEMEALARIDDPGVVGVLDTGLTAVHLSQWSPYLTNLGECTVKHGVKVHLSI